MAILKKLSFEKVIAIFLSLLLIWAFFYPILPHANIPLFSWIPTTQTIEKFQILISGILAFGAGSFVWLNGHHNRLATKRQQEEVKKKYRTYYAKTCRDLVIRSDVFHDILADTTPSARSSSIIEEFNNKFLEKDEHIAFFSNEEVEIIAVIEEYIHHANMRLRQMLEIASNTPEVPYSALLNQKRHGKTLRGVSQKAAELAKKIDEKKYWKWRNS